MSCRRAQASLEFLLVLTAFFAVFVVVAGSSVLLTGKARELLCVKNAQVALNQLASAVDSVYVLGPSNSTRVVLQPSSGCFWKLQASNNKVSLIPSVNGKRLKLGGGSLKREVKGNVMFFSRTVYGKRVLKVAFFNKAVRISF